MLSVTFLHHIMSEQNQNRKQKRKGRAQELKLTDHDYVVSQKENNGGKMEVDDDDDDLLTDSEVVTPVESPSSSPALKVKRKEKSDLSLEVVQANILAAVNQRADNLELMVRDNKSGIEELKTSINFAFAEIEDLKNENKKLSELCTSHEKTIKNMEIRLTETERYRRRWALRLYGLPEEREENVKRKAIDICQQIAPNQNMNQAIDVVHRIGRRDASNTHPRSVIILFAFRTARDEVWKNARNHIFLREKRLRFGEDLTQADKKTRERLWPRIEEARKQGKRAFFRGTRAFIEDVEIL